MAVEPLSAESGPRIPQGTARYICAENGTLPGSAVHDFIVTWGTEDAAHPTSTRWLQLQATKASGERYQFWLLSDGYPAETLVEAQKQSRRFLVQFGKTPVVEFQDRFTKQAVLPSVGGWRFLIPRAKPSTGAEKSPGAFPREVAFLGLNYRLEDEATSPSPSVPVASRIVFLLPNVMVGVPSNMRQKDPTRRYDGSEYDLVRLERADYREMAEAGMNCFRVDKDQLPFVMDLDVFYWGIRPNELSFPESLYDPRYLGPSLFLDEPAVGTRDSVLRPKLARDAEFRKSLDPATAFDAFREHYREAWEHGAATSLMQALESWSEVKLGQMRFPQENLYSWETMVSTAAYQLAQDRAVPAAIVFEPPGRVGTRRTVPELDMTYGCQIPVENPHYFIDIIYGFLRGAARLTDKAWGTSIYGAVDRTDAFTFLSRAYDLGATRFFFWDNAQLACVPYPECLALARAVRMRAENHPDRDVTRLRQAGEVAILLPAGYNLGHVALGKGNLWGLSELNLERTNGSGVPYRLVMANFFSEIERCLRLGIAFDLLGEFPGVQPAGYREIVRIREDGKVEVGTGDKRTVLEHARHAERPDGDGPDLRVTLSKADGKAPLNIKAEAVVTETSAPVYYTLGTDARGVYRNAAVAWELYGPTELDHRFLSSPNIPPEAVRAGQQLSVTTEIHLARPGNYRLRTATVDLAGRSSVRWSTIRVSE